MMLTWYSLFDYTERSRIALVTVLGMKCFAEAPPGKRKECMVDLGNEQRKDCVRTTGYSKEQCGEIADNGEYMFCSNVPNLEGCESSNKKLILPTSTTTETPFPIAHIIGAAAGGFLVAIILGLIIWFFKKKRNAKKGGNYGGTTGTGTTGTATGTGYTATTGTRKTGTV